MPSILPEGASTPPCSTIIHRPFGAVTGYRRLSDRASRVSVEAFPMEVVQRLAAAGMLATPGAYIMTDGRTAYLGESKRPGRRVVEHSFDATKKAFSREVYVISACEGCLFDKALILDLQFRLTRAALNARQVVVHKGINPPELEFADPDRASHDRIYTDAMRLLFDAGCRIFEVPPDRPADAARVNVADDASDADAGPIEIGVTTTPLGAEEFELQYGDLWARAYWADGHFIIAAGSEVRTVTNGSVNALTRARREELFRSGVLAEIPGVADRQRLVAAVAFPSSSIAAKVLAGAHTVSGWSTLARSRAVVLAA